MLVLLLVTAAAAPPTPAGAAAGAGVAVAVAVPSAFSATTADVELDPPGQLPARSAVGTPHSFNLQGSNQRGNTTGFASVLQCEQYISSTLEGALMTKEQCSN